MIISVWRYSHLALALSSLVFVLILSLTGIILAFDPIADKLEKHPSAHDFPKQNIAQTIEALQSRYSEILNFKVDANGFVLASIITKNGDVQELYVHPETGKKMGTLQEKPALINFATNLHRSLFLKSWGRFFVGLNSFLLFLIAATGCILIIKRQQGIQHFFNKIIRENFLQYGHVYLGRLALIPLLIITLTGVYLSLLRFEIIPSVSLSHSVNFETVTAEPKRTLANMPVFANTPLREARGLEFPFSDDPADYYTLSLHEKELLINQYTGETLSALSYPFVEVATRWSLALHTGSGSYVWSAILALACFSVFFFMYSGISMTLKRKTSKIKNRFSKKESTHILLVGSETGSTFAFACILQQQLIAQGVKVFVAQLNAFQHYPNMKHLVVLTATYGLGAPPTNAKKFQQKLKQSPPYQPFTFSVVGFGSLAYPEFCKYAFNVDAWLEKTPNATRLLNVQTVNNRSWETFRHWLKTWGTAVHLNLAVSAKSNLPINKHRSNFFEVKTKQTHEETFTLTLTSAKNKAFTSGDLLAIYPQGDAHERLYSTAVLKNKTLFISVKHHSQGVCSNALSKLHVGDLLEGSRVPNKHFYFPKTNKPVLLICSGTGIAPFLGMLEHNHKKTETHLYWGGQNEAAFDLYRKQIEKALHTKTLTSFTPAFSRQANQPKTYVQDALVRDAKNVARILQAKGFIMICGSVAMQQGVTEVLQIICEKQNEKPLSYYQKRGRIKMDCY